MKKIDLIKDIEVKESPSYLTEAALLIHDYLVWKTYKGNKQISFVDTDYKNGKDGKINFVYLVDKFSDKEDYINFQKELRKAALPYLENFFTEENEDIYRLSSIYRQDNKRDFHFLLSLLASFGRDSIKKVTKEDFHFQIKMIFLMFVDDTLLDYYAMADISRPMMEKKFQSLDLLEIMLATSYSNDQAMDIFKALYGWEDLYDRLYPLLTKLEEIIKGKFYLVEDRYRAKIKEYKESDFSFVYKLLDESGFNNMKLNKKFEAFLNINLLNPYSAAFRSVLLDPNKLELVFGIMMDEYYQEDQEEFSEQVNQNKLRTFSDPSRFEIIKLLQKRPYYVKEMADILFLTPATLSYHLNQLQIAGFIGLYYEGRKSYYYLRKETIKKLGDYLHYFADNIEQGVRNEKD